MYLVDYQLFPEFTISIFKEKGKTFAQFTDQEKIEIIPFEQNKFGFDNWDANLTFNIGDNGKVTSLTFNQGEDLEAKKIEN